MLTSYTGGFYHNLYTPNGLFLTSQKLIVAAKGGSLKNVIRCLKDGADINCQDQVTSYLNM